MMADYFLCFFFIDMLIYMGMLDKNNIFIWWILDDRHVCALSCNGRQFYCFLQLLSKIGSTILTDDLVLDLVCASVQ